MTQRLLTILSRPEVWAGGLALAGFLVLYWVLRGAPMGQAPRVEEDEGEGSPASGYRDRMVGAMVVGLLLILAGAYLAISGRLGWSLPIFALGFAVVLTLISVNRRYRHGSPTLRRTMELANSALGVTLVLGVLIVGNVLAFRYGGHAIDLTREGTFTLSSLSLNQLKTLKRPIAFTAFYGDSPRSVRQRDRIQQMLDLYKAADPQQVSVAYINPYAEVQRWEELTKRFPDIAVTQGGGLLIEYGEGDTAAHVVIRNNDLFDLPRNDRFDDTTLRFESSFKGEDAVTTALIRLREGKRPKIALIVGHGEPSTSELDPRKAGLGLFKSRLSALGYELVEVNLIRDEIPAEALLVAVVGPKTPYKAEEVAKLKGAVDAGKPVLAVIGGPETPGESTGLEGLWRSFNLVIGASVVIDPQLNFRGQLAVIYAPIMGVIHQPIVDPLANRPVLMPRTSPITIITPGVNAAGVEGVGEGAAINKGVLPVAILRTSNEAWSETDLSGKAVKRDDQDLMGPFTVGVAVTDRPRSEGDPEAKPRLVLFSSRYMADNLFLEVESTNLDVLMNAISWLRGQGELGGIAPKTHVALTLAADPALRARLILVPTVLAVLLIIGLGLTTYLARRE